MSLKLSIILPCYNEEAAISSVLTELFEDEKLLREKCALESLEVILVDDGSTDQSVKIAKKFPVQIIHHHKNQGYGAALKTGIGQAHGEWLLFYDLDSTCHLRDFVQLWQAHRDHGYEILSGQRLTLETQMPPLRQLGNQLFRALVKVMTGRGSNDACSGYRLFHKKYKSVFLKELPDELNFTLAMTVMALKNNWPFGEVPIKYTERKGISKLNIFVEGVRFFKTIISYSFKKPVHAKYVVSAGS